MFPPITYNLSPITSRRGQISVIVLFFATITVVLITGFIFLGTSFLQLSVRNFNKTLAFSIAEAGIEYYHWHLAHAPTDYQDGTGGVGPYTHTYYDTSGTAVGEFILAITPPPSGSTVVAIRSTGKVSADSTIQKVIEVKLDIETFVRYAAAINEAVRFGEGTETFGEVFSNGGIRFDGLAHNVVKSARSSYDDPDHGGQEEFGVHTHVDPLDPLPGAAVPSRTDVFEAGREFPVPALDFTQITQTLADIKSKAQASSTYFASSTVYGYDLVFATSGIYSVYKVTALKDPPNGCTNNSNEPGWGTWSIQTETLHATGTIPPNGHMFFEDNLWVRGQIDARRVTVGSGRFPDNPSTRSSITVNNNLRYTNYNATDTIGLVAQNNVNIGLFSDDILRIDAALIAQNGRVGRYYYQPPNDQSHSNKCGSTTNREEITLYGSVITNKQYEFGFDDETGYERRILIFDTRLLYEPPPAFPQTTDTYAPISWDEVQ